MIDAGKYRARAREWAFGLAKSGNEQIGVQFDLLDQPGESITWFGSFAPKALEFTLKALRACGWQGADLAELDCNMGGLEQNEVVLVVEHEEYQGKTSARVRWVNAAGGVGMANPLDQGGLKSFAARMRAQIIALDPTSAKAKPPPKAAPPRRAPEPPPHEDGDQPF